MTRDALDEKLIAAFNGKVVRKDLLLRIKSSTNIPTFVVEFLLARFCASDDDREIDEGLKAVIATIQDNYVRADEANAAQSKVATKGRYKFIDKVHVRYSEKEKRHWAELENFNSQRIAIPDKYYRDNNRMLEGGIWAEVTLCNNEVEDDDYTFYVEDLKPIQLSRFDFDAFVVGRQQFTRDEWMAIILRSVGLEPSKLNRRQQFHFLARLASLVESNYNFIEIGPRGTGKSYFFSEFTPYSTLISGGQASKSVLFYNNSKKRVGLVGFWDTIAFDEVGNVKIKDPDTIQIMKDYLANGRFSRGVEVIADASLSFVGNIDYSIQQVVNSSKHDLFMSLPKEFDLAVMDRFACYLPGWEMPKTGSAYLTKNYGFITDYLAEAFHYEAKHVNRYDEVTRRIKLGPCVEGRDEKWVKKTVCALLKMLHPGCEPTDEEFDEYVAYAIESRRRVKEQMNKRKPDDEFAKIDMSYFNANGEEVVVWCPESKDAEATQHPKRQMLMGGCPEPSPTTATAPAPAPAPVVVPIEPSEAIEPVPVAEVEEPEVKSEPVLQERHFKINYGDTGYSYDTIFGPYAATAKSVTIEDPYIRLPYQLQNFVRFCEAVLLGSSIKKVTLVTCYDGTGPQQDVKDGFEDLKQSLMDRDVELDVKFRPGMHDREVTFDNGWTVKIGRGLDFYQKPSSWYGLGSGDLYFRPCLETSLDIYKT